MNDVEKRLWIEVLERPARLVGGVVPKPDTDGGAVWDGEDEFKSGLWELERIDDPLKAMGEVAKPRDMDMDRCLGIEIDRGVLSADAAAGLPDATTDDVDLARWWDMVGIREWYRRWI